jgi:hypothetical protein
VIGYTSFEEPLTVGGDTVNPYSDALPPTSLHRLGDNDNQNPVSASTCLLFNVSVEPFAELGFRSYWEPTPDSPGQSGIDDNVNIGVIGDATTSMGGDGNLAPAPHGQQYYEITSLGYSGGGFVFVEMAPVAVSAYSRVQMKAWVLLYDQYAYYNDNTRLRIWASSEVGDEVDLVDATGYAMTGSDGVPMQVGRPFPPAYYKNNVTIPPVRVRPTVDMV